MQERAQIEREITDGILRLQRDLGIIDADTSSCGDANTRVKADEQSGSASRRLWQNPCKPASSAAYLDPSVSCHVRPAPQETYSRRSWPMKLADVTLVICVIAALTVILTYRVKAQTVTNDLLFDNRSEPIICTNTKQIIEIVKANPRFKEPRQFFGNDARHLSSNVANIIPPADHIVLLPMSDGGTIFAYCMPGNVWLHKRIVLDLAYEKNLNPEVPEEQELPKPKKRSRQPK